jgi:hypothetical protein
MNSPPKLWIIVEVLLGGGLHHEPPSILIKLEYCKTLLDKFDLVVFFALPVFS